MAGRGRGRGRGSVVSFSVDSLGFGRGEALPGPLLQPPPLYPPLEMKPVPLCAGEENDYLLALKQEYQGSMRESVYYLKEAERKTDVERYSDKYQLGQAENNAWHPDWLRVPSELRIRAVRSKKRCLPVAQGLLPVRPTLKTEDVTKQLEALEKTEAAQSDDDKEKEEGEEEEVEEDVYDEDDAEEETDYNMTYFDNGEIEDDDDELEDGPTY